MRRPTTIEVLRERTQILESRQRTALIALTCFWERLVEMSRDQLSVGDLEELQERMSAIRAILGEEGQP